MMKEKDKNEKETKQRGQKGIEVKYYERKIVNLLKGEITGKENKK